MAYLFESDPALSPAQLEVVEIPFGVWFTAFKVYQSIT